MTYYFLHLLNTLDLINFSALTFFLRENSVLALDKQVLFFNIKIK